MATRKYPRASPTGGTANEAPPEPFRKRRGVSRCLLHGTRPGADGDAQEPAIFIRSISTEPMVLPPSVYASAPTAATRMKMSRRLPAMVIS
jgi:hypothetical protein